MLDSLMFLASYAELGGGNIANLLQSWKDVGIIDYMLPFLLIFVIVFGILDKTKLFDGQKFINGVIGLVVGIMALQFEFVPTFFSEVFPRLGIGLGVILIVMILLGIFMPKQSWVSYTLFGIAAIILIVVLVKTSGALGWSAGYWWQANWPTVVGAIFIIILVAVIIGASGPKSKFEDTASPFLRELFGLKGDKASSE